MSNRWLYDPDRCDGDFCPMDCDRCQKWEEMQIEWFEPTVARNRGCEKDVSIRVVNSNGKYKTAIYFYNDSHRKITHGERIIVGISTDRIFFKDALKGYKLSKSGSRYRVIIPAVLRDMEGDYNLQYHAQEELYFISLTEGKNG